MDLTSFVTVEQAATQLDCHPNTIRNMEHRGELPNTYRNGRVVLIAKQDILAAVEAAKKREAG